MAEVRFLGFRQETLEDYNKLSDAEKKHYMWLIREFAQDDTEKKTPLSVAIYFGNRKYAETNQVDANLEMKVNAIITAIGGSVDQDGKYQGFLPIAGDDILSDESVTTLTVALQKLSQAIKANKEAAQTAKDAADNAQQDIDNLAEKVGSEASEDTAATGIFAKIDDIEKKLDPEQDGSLAKELETVKSDVSDAKGNITDIQNQIGNVSSDTKDASGILGDIEKLQKSGATKDEVKAVEDKLAEYYKKTETYTQTEINEKLASLLRWKGALDNLDAIKAIENPVVGDVYHSNENGAEYVYTDANEWEFLGVNVSLDGYVTEDALTTKLADYATTAVTNGISEKITELSGATVSIETKVGNESKGLVKDVTDLQNKATRFVDDYSKIKDLEGCTAGQIVFANGTYTDPDNSGKTYTSGAYLVTAVDEAGKPTSIFKIEATSTEADETPINRISALETQVKTIETTIGEKGKDGQDGKGLLGDVEKIQREIDSTHIVSGDDVEV